MGVETPAKELRGMVESLEGSGFERRQAETTIEVIAESIEKFAVTPKVLARELAAFEQRLIARMESTFTAMRVELRAELAEVRTELRTEIRVEMNQRFADQNAVWDARFNDLRADMNRQFELLLSEIKSTRTRQRSFEWLLLGAALSLLGAIFAKQFL